MGFLPLRLAIFFCCIYLCSGCANIVPPQGGAKDVTPPKLLAISPGDSALNTRVSKIELRFDEFITISNAANEVTISPILPFPPGVEANGRRAIVTIPDTLLQDNTTYRISFGKAIQDVHENNPFVGYNYIFSTGSYFDSLKLRGYVMNAVTGLRDTGALVVLHDAAKSDSVVVREKPLYAVKSVGGGFLFEGLPARAMKIFAIRDKNSNMIYDGGEEMVAFREQTVMPDTGLAEEIVLKIFPEAADSLAASASAPSQPVTPRAAPPGSGDDDDNNTGFSYRVLTDTSDTRRRTQEVNEPLKIRFNRPLAEINSSRYSLGYDSAGVQVEVDAILQLDTAAQTVNVSTAWQQNALYTLRLLKGFAKDSAGTEAMPGRYTFRTKRDEDYAKLHIHLPARFYGGGFVLAVFRGDDTVYHRTVRDTMITLNRLQPGTYTMRVIADANNNGKWDSGDLFARRQPEEVIPYEVPVNMKAGWENIIDFDEQRRGKKGVNTGGNTNPPK